MAVLELPDWTPAVSDVGLRLIGRTRMPNGALAGTFNQQTTPTDTTVQQIIQQQVRLLAPQMGDVPDALADSATALLALKAAMVVEQSYFIEQVGADLSPYKELCDEFKFAFLDWQKAAMGDTPDGVKTWSLSCGTLYPGYATGTY